MSTEDKLFDALKRMQFVQRDAERIASLVKDQDFITPEQDEEATMLMSLADEIQGEVDHILDEEEPSDDAVAEIMKVSGTPMLCGHCNKPVIREAGLWLHADKRDFERCGRVGVPKEKQ
jgi:hypothetical protein